jgi:hypothetical protein
MSPKVSKYENKHTIDYDGGGGDNENYKWGTCTEGTDKVNLKKNMRNQLSKNITTQLSLFCDTNLKWGYDMTKALKVG